MNEKRKFVCQKLYEKYGPRIIGGPISRKEINTWWCEYTQRIDDTSDKKVGYPQWIFVDKRFRGPERRTYVLPAEYFEDVDFEQLRQDDLYHTIDLGLKQRFEAYLQELFSQVSQQQP